MLCTRTLPASFHVFLLDLEFNKNRLACISHVTQIECRIATLSMHYFIGYLMRLIDRAEFDESIDCQCSFYVPKYFVKMDGGKGFPFNVYFRIQ